VIRRPIDVREVIRATGALLLVVATLNLGFWLFVTRPQVRESERLSVGTDPQQRALLERRVVVEKQEQFLAALERVETDLTRLRDDVLATRETRMIGVQLEVAELCERFGIDWSSVRIDNEILVDEELDRLVMSVPLEGGYANLRRFLQAVEVSDEFLVVEHVALAESNDGGVMLQLNVSLATYFDSPGVRARNRAERPPRGPARAG